VIARPDPTALTQPHGWAADHGWQDSSQTRVARRIIQVLDARLGDGLPHDIDQRLRVARQQALAVARHARLAAQGASTGVVTHGDASAALIPPRWLRVASWLPLLVLVAGLWGISHFNEWERIQAAAEIDTFLLADDLPPQAYVDPGFAEFLRQSSP